MFKRRPYKVFSGRFARHDYPGWWRQWSGINPLWPWLLSPLASLYCLLVALRPTFTRHYRAAVPVVCVGNIAVGGVGKTPIIIAIARALQDLGLQVHILGHGYGGTINHVKCVKEDDSVQHVGDEALLTALVAPTWVGGKRVQRAKAAAQAGAGIIIMDDGWQDPSLKKDFVITVLDAQSPLGNGWMLPLGPLRQLPKALAQVNQRIFVQNQQNATEKYNNNIFYSEKSDLLVTKQTRWRSDPPSQKQVVLFCGIGQSSGFFTTAQSLCAQSYITVVACYGFIDHHIFTAAELEHMQQQHPHSALVTTAKDHVRLTPEWQSRVIVIDLHLLWTPNQGLDDLLQRIAALVK